MWVSLGQPLPAGDADSPPTDRIDATEHHITAGPNDGAGAAYVAPDRQLRGREYRAIAIVSTWLRARPAIAAEIVITAPSLFDDAGLAVAGGVVLSRRRVRLLPLTAQLVGVTVTAALVWGAVRFRAPAEVVIVAPDGVAVPGPAGRILSAPGASGR